MVALQLLANGIVNGAVLAVLALGFALVYNTTRVFHLAHGAAFVLAPYVAYSLVHQVGATLVWGCVAGVLTSAVFGFAVSLFIYLPLFKVSASGAALLVSSLGAYAVATNLVAIGWGNEPLELHPEIWMSVYLGLISLTEAQLIQLVTSACIGGLVLLLLATGMGRLLRAVRDDPELTSVLGFDLRVFRTGVVTAGSALAGVAGVLRALDGAIDPHMGMSAVLEAAVAFIVGGVGTFGGPVAAGIGLGMIQGLATWVLSVRWVEAIVFLILVIFVLVRPAGLFGQNNRAEQHPS